MLSTLPNATRPADRAVRIAVASGKGGTGKTTIATSLATIMAEEGLHVAYLDCDVEEPNGHLLLDPVIDHQRPVTTTIPEIDPSRCRLCGACARACRFSALLALPDQILTFPELCHACGACVLACPDGAIRERLRVVGTVSGGTAGQLAFRQGTLNVGEIKTTTLIRATIDSAPAGHTLILDAPPGTSCPVVETMRAADVILLVTEPTPFGLRDLRLAAETVHELGLPFGVAVNRTGIGHGQPDVYEYCLTRAIPVLLDVPNDLRIAEAYSRGHLAVRAQPSLARSFARLGTKLRDLAGHRQDGRTPPGQQRSLAAARPVYPDHRIDPDSHTSLRLNPVDQQDANRKAGPVPAYARGSTGAEVAELVIISGKGGTGKTTIAASFLALAAAEAGGKPSTGAPVVADCDVDAPDLDLVLRPTVRAASPFSGGETGAIDSDQCTGCGLCADQCRFDAIERNPHGCGYTIDRLACEGCGVCASVCPQQAVQLQPAESGVWQICVTQYGPMVQAQLHPGQGNSGKLVSLVRSEARAIALQTGADTLICDGPPGVGCPAIASVTGASAALIVTEPTLSGLHDLRRAAELTRQFAIITGVCVNKYDINPALTERLEAEARALGLAVLGRIRYDASAIAVQLQEAAVVEVSNGPAAEDIRSLWRQFVDVLNRRRRGEGHRREPPLATAGPEVGR